MKRLLSTKELDRELVKLFEREGISFRQYNALEYEYLPVQFGELPAIFTSRNAVKACFEQDIDSPFHNVPECYCVGEKAAGLLKEYGQEIVAQEADAASLAKLITTKYTDKSFIYYCSDRRLDTLHRELKSAGIPIEERVVYKTKFRKQHFANTFDGILFFSPSGVQSYLELNELGNAWAFCIGNTTAGEVKKYTDKIKIAKQPQSRALAELAIQFFMQDKTEIHE